MQFNENHIFILFFIVILAFWLYSEIAINRIIYIHLRESFCKEVEGGSEVIIRKLNSREKARLNVAIFDILKFVYVKGYGYSKDNGASYYRIVEITTPTGKEFVKCFELKVRNFLIIEMKIISAFKF